MSYRVKQFIWAVTAEVTEAEKTYINEYLAPEEVQLFEQLKVYEQKHSIKVAQAMAQDAQAEDRINRIRVGLLHDIGKIIYPIGPIRKSMMVLLHKFTKGRISRVRISDMVKCYYEHPQLGYEILKKKGGYEQEFLEVIRDHHKEKMMESNLIGKELKKWDNRF